MKTVAECLDNSDHVLEKKETTENNPYPNARPPFSRFATADRDGKVRTEDSNGSSNVIGTLTKEEQEKLNRDLHEQASRMQAEFQKQQNNLEESMRKMQQQMQSVFGDRFPFGNNFPFAAPNPFTSYAPSFPFNNFAAYPNTHAPHTSANRIGEGPSQTVNNNGFPFYNNFPYYFPYGYGFHYLNPTPESYASYQPDYAQVSGYPAKNVHVNGHHVHRVNPANNQNVDSNANSYEDF